jgi:hypothetical protein
MKYAYLAIGVLALLIGVYGLLQIRDIKTKAGLLDALQQHVGAERDMEALMGIMSTGLWFVTLGGLILAGTGLVNAFSQRVEAPEKAAPSAGGARTVPHPFGAPKPRTAVRLESPECTPGNKYPFLPKE